MKSFVILLSKQEATKFSSFLKRVEKICVNLNLDKSGCPIRRMNSMLICWLSGNSSDLNQVMQLGVL